MGESIAWLAVSRPHIGLAHVIADSYVSGPGTMLQTRQVDLRLASVIAGNPPQQARFQTVVTHTEADATGARVLAFGDENAVVDAIVGLDRLDLGPAMTASFSVLTDPAAILDGVEASRRRIPVPAPGTATRARHLDEPQRAFLRFAVPENTAAHQILYAGASCYLVVPVDPQFRGDVVRHSRSGEVWERARAAHQLANYADPDVVERLREMLSDPGSVVMSTLSGGHRTERRLFPSSQIAFDTLIEVGVRVSRPDGYVADFPYIVVWPGSAALAA